MPKIFVLDTNVILHKGDCIYDFDDNDVYIPVSILEELDRFKTGTSSINYNARNFIRIIDELSGDDVFNGGVEIAEDKGKLIMILEQEFEEEIKENFPSRKTDHSILNSTLILKKKNPDRKVVLISKDVNLRMKAKAIGLLAQDLTIDQVSDVDKIYKGVTLEENVPADIISLLYQDPFQISIDLWGNPDLWLNNQYLILKNGSSSALAQYSSSNDTIRRLSTDDCFNIKPRNAEQFFAADAATNKDIKLVTLSGKAGTGKTLIALAASLAVRSEYRRIFMARPVVPLSNKDSGFLPGDINEKLNPYIEPLYDNLAYIKDNEKGGEKGGGNKEGVVDRLLESEKIIVQPLHYIRGRSLPRVFFIIDEAQNLTPHEVKTIVTRAGEGTKIVFTGDINQIDHPYLTSKTNGLSYLIEKMKGQKMYAHVHMQKGERSQLANLAAELL